MTTITETYAALAQRVAQRLGSPRVRALHLPPARASAKASEFCALELEDGSIGFSYVLVEAVQGLLQARPDANRLVGADAAAIARGYANADPVAKALGFAAINALTQQLFSRAGWLPRPAGDSLGEVDPVAGDHIGMIGLFPPLVPRIAQAGARLTVLELRPELEAEYRKFKVTLDPAELNTCQKIVSTCTVMLNDTLDGVLAACRNARQFAIIGPTAGCLPDPLLARGVTAIGGRHVKDARGFLDAFSKGEKWGEYANKYVITPEDYPGVEQLLERVD